MFCTLGGEFREDEIMKQLVISLLLIVFSATVASAYPVGDLNEDWSVNFSDLKLFTEYWLEEPDCFNTPRCADLVGNDRVDLQDLALLAENWFMSVTPTLVINEFMASNDTALEDPDDAGDFPDWIEIYNYGTETISMAGMMLNDSTDEFLIGAGVTIGAGEHLIFYADKDHDAVPYQGPMHTNFKLDASGDEIYLFNTNGILIDSKTYSNTQMTDYSSGRYPDNTDSWYTMETSTPGTANQTGIAGQVWFSRLSGTFTNDFNLELSTESPTAEIRYTTNGALPAASSTLYTGPRNIDNAQARMIRARVFDPPLAPGPIQSHYYIPLASDLQNFSSNLPIVIVDSYGENIDNNGTAGCGDHNYLLHPVATIFIDTDKDSGLASTTDVPAFAGRAGTKIRGESSRCWPKRQYSLELWDENDSDAKSSLLSLPSESDWILHAPYSDKTQLRNLLSYKWFNDLGQYAPRTRLVEVFFNQSVGNTSYADYRGVYVLMERVKVSENRVDIAKLDETDTMEPDITGGYILRIDKDNGQEKFTTSRNMIGTFQYYDPDEYDLTSDQKTYIRGWLDEFETVLNSSYFNDPVNGYAKYVDVDDFIKYDLLLEIQKNADGLRLSTYMNKDRNGKLAMGPIWDCNLTYGNAYYLPGFGIEWYHRADSVYEDWFNDNSMSGIKYTWYDRMLQDSDYKMRYADMWFSLRETVISDEGMLADIDYYYDLLDPDGPSVNTASTPVDRNYVKWPVLGTTLWPNYYVGSIYDDEISWFKNWIAGDGVTDNKDVYSNRLQWVDELWELDRNVSAPPTLSINGSAMNTGGNVEVGATLTMTGSSGTIYYTTDGTDPREWTHWESGEGTDPFTATLVTESASKKVLVPTGPVSDNWKGSGSFDDSGWASTTGGIGYATADGDWYEPYINYDVESLMRGDGKNETCYIRTPFSAVAPEDYSNMEYLKLRIRYDDAFVAYINGVEVARSSLVPTPLEWNSGSTGPVAESTALIEFDITAYKDVLNLGSGNILAIHGLNRFLTSSDFLMSFELKAGSNDSGIGGELSQNAIAYAGDITLDSSKKIKARIKNGSNWSALNEAIFSMNNVASSLRITELMYHPADPNDEYIEFKNIGVSSIDVAHCQLTKGVDFTFPDMTLASGGYTIAVRSIADFNLRYPGYSGTIAGEYTNDKLDNGGENIRLKDAAGIIIQEFDYEDGWFPITDGKGFSLNIINAGNATLDNWNKRLSWQASNVLGGTPGQGHTANAIANDAIVINEVLTHTDGLAYGDWIELRNTTGAPINIGGWYLSDDIDNLKKYKIYQTVTIAANGYRVYTSVTNFRNKGGDIGCITEFGLSELGEDVFLTSGDGSDISGGYSASVNFGAAENDATFGRHTKSDGNVDFVRMTSQTMGYANSTPPYVPDVVISEIMYNAKDIKDLLGEYIELYNPSGPTVYLYDVSNPSNTWKFTKGIEFEFPTGVSIAAGERILISRALPAAFKTANSISGVTVYGPFENHTELANDGEKIELSMPGAPEPGTGYVPYIRVEQVNYSDGVHPLGNDPWPTGADARGDSLHRDSVSSYSNDASNWSDAQPTPGS